MGFKLIKKLKSGVRVGELSTPHGVIQTPFFMPVGTVGTVKGVSSEELGTLGAEIVLSNAYHLYLRPGEKLIKKLGGLHQFMNWNKPILTDSGGYQVFSLGRFSDCHSRVGGNLSKPKIPDQVGDDGVESLVRITEDGVEFRSHLDGSKHFFTPEKVIQIQIDLGVDILMPLDFCPSGKANYEEVKRATDLTVKWAERAKKYFDKKMHNAKRVTRNASGVVRPLLHGIVQGGLYPDLRKECAEKLIEMNFDGYSVGGLAVDLETREMWDIVKLMGELLPKDKPRYLMGVGTPDDIIKATSLGMDMFDCVLPTRLGRHGCVYIETRKMQNAKRDKQVDPTSGVKRYSLSNLLNAKYRSDGGVIDENCDCPACRGFTPGANRGHLVEPVLDSIGDESAQTPARWKGGYSKAYISHLLKSKEILGVRLTTLHNLYIYLELMRRIKEEYKD